MKIVGDEPGRRLVLEGAVPPPYVAYGILALALLFFIAFPMQFLLALISMTDELPLAVRIGGGVLLAFGGIALLSGLIRLLGSLRRTSLLSFERPELRIAERGGFTPAREERVAGSDLASLRVSWSGRGGARLPPEVQQLAARQFAARFGFSSGFQLRLQLRIASQAGELLETRAREFSVAVDDLDKPEEIADLALRMAAAAGLPFYRVLRNEPRGVDIELARSHAAGMQRVPAIATKADYGRDAVADVARTALAEERVPPFDAAAFPSQSRVTVWSPGREVRFERPVSWVAFGCAPFMLALLLGPVLFVLSGYATHPPPLGSRIGGSAIMGFFGLLIGGLATLAVVSCLPRRVALDWDTRRLSIAGFRERKDIPFSDLVAIEMRSVLHKGKNSTTYSCRVLAHRREAAGTAAGEELIVTRSCGNSLEPYQATLPLATELAEALKVERRISP